MAVAPSVQASTQTDGGEDQLSPTTLVLNALRKAGVPITNENIRRFVSSNARESGQSGPDLIAGLRSGPVEDSGPSVGQSGSAAKAVEGGTKKEGYLDDGTFTDANRGGDQSGSKPSSTTTQSTRPEGTPSNVAIPSSGPPIVVDPGSGTPGVLGPSSGGGPNWLDALLPAGVAALIQGAQAIPGRGDGFVGNSPIPPTGRVMDVNPPAIGADGIPTLQVTAQQPPAPPPSPMEMSMQNAMRPALGAPGPNPAEIIGAGQQLPAGINPLSVPTQPTGPSTQIIPQNVQGAPRVPLRPGAGGAGPIPGAGVNMGQRILRGLRLP